MLEPNNTIRAKRQAVAQSARDKGKERGKPVGRPKGSKNKITFLKLLVEQSVREDNQDKMGQVCAAIINDALKGDLACRKMVWQAVMSNGIPTDSSTPDKVSIEIKAASSTPQPIVEVIEHPSQEELEEDEQEAN